MASNNQRFEPPARPNANVLASQRRQGYQIPPQERSTVRDYGEDSAYIQSRKERRKVDIDMNMNNQPQTGLPRPSLLQPSLTPVPRSKSENSYRGTMASTLRAGGQLDRTMSPAPAPTMKGKASRNVLRRKPSSIAQHVELSRPSTARTATEPPKWTQRSEVRPSIEALQRPSLPNTEAPPRFRQVSSPTKELRPKVIPELDRYRTRPEQQREFENKLATDIPYKLSTPDISPPNPSFGFAFSSSGSGYNRHSGYSGSGYSASPSTRFSESPGPSAYSRDTTPTSMSSVSPGVHAPFKSNLHTRRGSSPTRSRPPLTRRHERTPSNEHENNVIDPQGLPALRESVNSSSSNSTVKAEGKGVLLKERKKKKALAPRPPSPPPRKSSQKFKKSTEGETSPGTSTRSRSKSVISPEIPPPIPTEVPVSPPTRPTPPRRPSRDGAPDLRTQLGDFALFQSNFTGIKYLPDAGNNAPPHVVAPSPPQILPRQMTREPSRNPSPTFVTTKREPSPIPTGLGFIPNLRAPARGPATRTPSPSLESGKPRFGFFGRKAKTTPEIGLAAPAENPPRKGPAAGTGHEGYGRYALRGRSTGVIGPTGVSHGRSLSGSSTTKEQPGTQDPFFRDRMNPVVISGGGAIKENRNSGSVFSRTESNTSLVALSKNSSYTSLSQESPQPILQPSAIPKDGSKRVSSAGLPTIRKPSDGQPEDQKKPPLAFRRSMQRLNNSTSALVPPKPLNTAAKAPSASMSSIDPIIMVAEPKSLLKDDIGRGREEQATKPKKLEKRARSPRKWNFFHRQAPKVQSEASVSPVKVTVGRQPVKAIPHYAMIDSSDEPEDSESVDLEDILRDSNVVELTDEQLDELQFSNYKENIRRIEELQTAMAPSLPEVMPATTVLSAPVFSSPEPMFPPSPEIPQVEVPAVTEVTAREVTPVRPSRLQQVGRIPKVVPSRPEATSPISFSRPFARLSMIQPLMEGIPSFDAESIALGASPPKFPSLDSNTSQSDSMLQEVSNEKTGTPSSIQHEFLRFSPRKNSSATTTSSSNTNSFSATTAIIPSPTAALAEDEVWDEYDDLISTDNASKSQSHISTTSSLGVPFQYETYQSHSVSGSGITILPPHPTRELPPTPIRKSALTTSSIYSTSTNGEPSMIMGANLRDALATIPSPSTPVSLSGFFPDFVPTVNTNRNSHSNMNSNTNFRDLTSLTNRKSNHSSMISRKSNSSSATTASRISGASLARISSQESAASSPISQVNLRVGSMTVSKWLTFGHVLFSPAREEILVDGRKGRILVIDGLGNDDWSFYAAETYPSHTFTNLSPSPSHPTHITPTSYPSPPPNHQQIPFHPFSTQTHKKFPFSPSTFSTCILRFPPALPPQTYAHLLSECRRVLKPGGYIEITLLDLDMLNMGPRTRRAVRGLKLRLRDMEDGVCLGSVGDLVLRLLGEGGKRRSVGGWGDVKRGGVGVPVVGCVAGTTSGDSKAPEKETRGVATKKNTREMKQKKEERSLADLMKDPSPEGDENITKMVAKVARWWYTRCYEKALLEMENVERERNIADAKENDAKRKGKGKEERGEKQKQKQKKIGSIFSDRAIVDECESWNASFKLVVIHAQKPVRIVRRRTRSF